LDGATIANIVAVVTSVAGGVGALYRYGLKSRFDTLEARFDSVEETLDGHGEKLDEHSRILGEHGERLAKVETDVEWLRNNSE